MLDNLNFDHDAENFNDAIGLSERNWDIGRYTTVYCIISPAVAAALYGNESGPRSKSNIFEDTLAQIKKNNNQEQLIAFLMMFETTYRKTLDRLETYRDVLSEKLDGENPALQAIRADSLDDAIKKISRVLDAGPVAQMVKVLKLTNCSYDKFIEFTVDCVDLRVVTGEITQAEVDAEDDEDDDSAIERKIKEALKINEPSKKKAKNYDDIDEIIRKAFKDKDKDEE